MNDQENLEEGLDFDLDSILSEFGSGAQSQEAEDPQKEPEAFAAPKAAAAVIFPASTCRTWTCPQSRPPRRKRNPPPRRYLTKPSATRNSPGSWMPCWEIPPVRPRKPPRARETWRTPRSFPRYLNPPRNLRTIPPPPSGWTPYPRSHSRRPLPNPRKSLSPSGPICRS